MTDSRNGVAGQLHRRVDMRVVDVADVVAAAAVAVGRDLVVVRQ